MKSIKQIFFLLHLAWVWLFLFVLHVFVVEYLAWQNFFAIALSKVVYFSCFLLFPVGEALEDIRIFWLLFILQFSFWSLISLVNSFIYKKFNA
jgi:hypothetical protein